ncbi:hypothetical protein BS50DRAFT_578813 [Corynespora cassiicola Philippines]|uniref:Uncharacterized protein n=1 Tax=Corynespora cassiicola Philippines TaxID=1448308 RepID=A0A2T2N6G7_CORCC|nr:hypothetical protein BS50DRAFT_578813 [Corynespora cassiicola Philippines]
MPIIDYVFGMCGQCWLAFQKFAVALSIWFWHRIIDYMLCFCLDHRSLPWETSTELPKTSIAPGNDMHVTPDDGKEPEVQTAIGETPQKDAKESVHTLNNGSVDATKKPVITSPRTDSGYGNNNSAEELSQNSQSYQHNCCRGSGQQAKSHEQREKSNMAMPKQVKHDEQITKIFLQLSSAVTTFALKLHAHIDQHSIFQRDIHKLSESAFLIKDTPDHCWIKSRSLLLRAVIWSHLRDSIFSHQFAIFGERAVQTAQEWMPTDLDDCSRAWFQMTADLLMKRAGILYSNEAGFVQTPETLAILLSKKHDINESAVFVTEALNGASTFQEALGMFKGATLEHRNAIHHVRESCVDVLDNLAARFSAKGKFKKSIEEVITLAQVFALATVSLSNEFCLTVASYGHPFNQQDLLLEPVMERTLLCGPIDEGRVVFTVRPGLAHLSEGADSWLTEIPAEVFIDNLSMEVVQSTKRLSAQEEFSEQARIQEEHNTPTLVDPNYDAHGILKRYLSRYPRRRGTLHARCMHP